MFPWSGVTVEERPMEEFEGDNADPRDGMGAVVWMVLSCLVLAMAVLALLVLSH